MIFLHPIQFCSLFGEIYHAMCRILLWAALHGVQRNQRSNIDQNWNPTLNKSLPRRRTTHAGNQGWKYYSWTSHDFSSLLSLPIHNMLTESSYILQLQSIKLNLFMRFGGKSKSTAAVIHFLHHHQDLKKRCQISSWNLMGTWMWGIVHQLWHDVDRDLMIIKWW